MWNVLLFLEAFFILATSSLRDIDFTQIDSQAFDTILIQYELSDTNVDELVTDIAEMSLYFSTNDEFCYKNALKIIDETAGISNHSKIPFISNECFTKFVIYKMDFDFFSSPEPYYFALKVNFDGLPEALFEIQTSANKKVEIGKWTNETFSSLNQDIYKRRSDFNGAKIRLTVPPFMPYFEFDPSGNPRGIIGDSLVIFQKEFNFTFDWISYHGHGSASANGSWSGAILDLINNDLDLGKF